MSVHEYDILEDKHTLIESGIVRFYISKDVYIEAQQDGNEVNIRGVTNRGTGQLCIRPVVCNSILIGF